MLPAVAVQVHGPDLPHLLHTSCRALTSLELHGFLDDDEDERAPLALAPLYAALAALPSLQLRKLSCIHFLPSQGVPPGVTSLHVQYAAARRQDLELLLLRASHPASRLRNIELEELHCSHFFLRASNLGGVQLPKLRTLDLQLVDVAELEALDLSWLAGSRRFSLCLSLGDQGPGSSPPSEAQWLSILHLLRSQRVLCARDSLHIDTGAQELPLTAQEVLSTLQPESVHLVLPPQSLTVLPSVSKVSICFWRKDRADEQLFTAAVSWEALVGAPGKVSISSERSRLQAGGPILHVSGCPAGRDSRLPGHVCVSGFVVTGLGR